MNVRLGVRFLVLCAYLVLMGCGGGGGGGDGGGGAGDAGGAGGGTPNPSANTQVNVNKSEIGGNGLAINSATSDSLSLVGENSKASNISVSSTLPQLLAVTDSNNKLRGLTFSLIDSTTNNITIRDVNAHNTAISLLLFTPGLTTYDPSALTTTVNKIEQLSTLMAFEDYLKVNLRTMTIEEITATQDYFNLYKSCIDEYLTKYVRSSPKINSKLASDNAKYLFIIPLNDAISSLYGSTYFTLQNYANRYVNVYRRDIDWNNSVVSTTLIKRDMKGAKKASIESYLFDWANIVSPTIFNDSNKIDFTKIQKVEYWISGPGFNISAADQLPSSISSDLGQWIWNDGLFYTTFDYILLPFLDFISGADSAEIIELAATVKNSIDAVKWSVLSMEFINASSNKDRAVAWVKLVKQVTLAAEKVLENQGNKALKPLKLAMGWVNIIFGSANCLYSVGELMALPPTVKMEITNDDVTSPTIPGNVTADTISSSQINISWAASTDNTLVSGYKVFRNGILVKNVTTGTTYSDTSLLPSTQYCYTISAYDPKGNQSGTGTNVCKSTSAITPSTYSISGQVTSSGTGLSGVTVSTSGGSATTDGSGNYSISGLTNGSYTVSASKTGYTMSASQSVTVSSANVTGKNFTATSNTTVNPSTYSISGQVTSSGVGLSGVTVSTSGGSATTDGSGNYSISGLANGSYTVSASKTGYTMSASQSVTVNSANAGGINFTATLIPSTYSISGQVTLNGAGLSGVTVTLAGSGSTSTTTDSSGNYVFSGAQNGSYTVTASKTGYTMSASLSVTVSNANVTGKNFTATVIPSTYSISGQVTLNGAGLSGVTVTLAGSGSTSTTTDSSGNYVFSGAQNGSYTVTASKTGYTMSASLSVTVSNADVTGKNFTATAIPSTYSISGKVTMNGTGLPGVTVTLTGSGSTSTTTDSSGNYSFSGAQNGGYTVTPTLAGYAFTPASRAVTVNGANATVQDFTATNTGSITGRW
ncbi:MAG: carboxypeptidase regulatory-like domain-containing protein [Desulfuromonadales bacterium]